jgi:hypothetical protein
MKTLAIEAFVGALALATLITAPALAQSARRSVPDTGFGVPYDRQITRDPNDVVVNGKVRGRDPDPFIREQLLRGYELGGSQD